MKTAFGLFASWLLEQIPDFIRSEVGKAVAQIPKAKDGKTGPQGVSVVDAEVALDGNLVIKLSNGSIIDAGEIVQQVASHSYLMEKQVANYQITVSATAPQSPQVNDLWYDIS